MRLGYFYIISILFHVVLALVIVSIPARTIDRIPERPIVARIIRPESVPPPVPEVPPPPRPDKEQYPTEDEVPSTIEGGGKAGGKPKRPKGDADTDILGEDLKLVEQKAIENVLREQRKDRDEREEDRSITFSTEEYKYKGYKAKLKERIESIWKYPPEAAEKGLYADLYIRFTIDRKGDLIDAQITRTSGYKMLDDAAMRALKEGAPYWPLPDSWNENTFTISGHFIYSLKGYYLR